METGETGVPGDLGQTVQYLVEVEAKEEAERDNVIIQNLSMEEMNVREMSKKKALRSVIQIFVQVKTTLLFSEFYYEWLGKPSKKNKIKSVDFFHIGGVGQPQIHTFL